MLQGKVTLKQPGLAEALDPTLQAAQAVALNLKLMKWRAAPGLDIAAIANQRCLLLGVYLCLLSYFPPADIVGHTDMSVALTFFR